LTRYEYDDARVHPALLHNLVRIVDPEGRTIVENIYGQDPEDDGFNRVVGQYFRGDEFECEYTRLRWVPPVADMLNDACCQTTLRSTTGPVRVYTFNWRGDLLDERFRLTCDGSFRLWAQSYRYNAQGERIEVRLPNGLGKRYLYDHGNPNPCARGNLLRMTRIPPPPPLQPEQFLWSFTYEPRCQGKNSPRSCFLAIRLGRLSRNLAAAPTSEMAGSGSRARTRPLSGVI
jgi:hypothetical protein